MNGGATFKRNESASSFWSTDGLRTATRQKGTPQNDGSGDANAMPMSHAS
jgi:hypothetical protein